MKTILSKEDLKLFEIYLDIIIDATKHLNSGNIAHKAATIKNHAKAIKKIIQEN